MSRSFGSIVLALLVVAAVVPVAGGVAAQEDTPTPAPNGTEVRHVDPDETNEDGDLGSVNSALQRQLATRLANSSIQLSQGEYERAKELVGEDYNEQYGNVDVEVAGETDQGNQSNAFTRAQEHLRELNSAVAQYNQTLRSYRDAKRAGNETRTRRLARELGRLAANISTSRAELIQTYAGIENRTDVNMTTAMESVNQTANDIADTQSAIRDSEFVATTLRVAQLQNRSSFTDPLVVEGRLTTENGTAIANQTIVVAVSETQISARTNESGSFNLTYRPVTQPVGPTTATIRYVPNETSAYLGSQSQAGVFVEQTEVTVSIESSTNSTSFNEGVIVSGHVGAKGAGVPDLPLVLSVKGERFGRTNTTADGEFTVTGRLPASVPAGEQSLHVTIPLEDRAVAGSTEMHPVTVEQSDTELTVDADSTASSVTVTGQLRTTDGDVVLDQDIEIRRDGEVVATTQTGKGGRYEATIPGESGEEYRLAVAYGDSTTNLDDASASATVTLPLQAGDPLGTFAQGPALVGGGVVLLLLVVGVWWWRRDDAAQASDEVLWTRDDGPEASGESVDDAATGENAAPTPDDLLTAARASLGGNADAAVERAYTAARQQLRAQGLGSDDATHWEFCSACADAGLENVDELETLTVLYEQAAFGPSEVGQADAETALQASDELI